MQDKATWRLADLAEATGMPPETLRKRMVWPYLRLIGASTLRLIDTLHSTPCTYTLHTTHYTLHTTHYTLHTAHYTLHTSVQTLRKRMVSHPTPSTPYLHTTHYTLHTIHYTLTLHTSV